DGNMPCGVNENALAASVRAEIPVFIWPLKLYQDAADSYSDAVPVAPDTLMVLDFVEFLHANVAMPIVREHHSYHRHNHLSFNEEEVQVEFVSAVNRLFARNGVAYELMRNGYVKRVLPPVIGEVIARCISLRTGDLILDNMLSESCAKFTDPNPLIRREGLERLWDGWERLKCLADAENKKKSIAVILNRASSETVFRGVLEAEVKALTDIGNSHLIRHSEPTQTPVIDTDHVDYLFYRMFALIQLLIQKNLPV
ncbi:hypothetical protein PLA106_22863, partial [Pseudomonas amygdali pv. lachrymans str. M302278]